MLILYSLRLKSAHGDEMSDLLLNLSAYVAIGALAFGIGLVGGYIALSRYYTKRFLIVGKECSDKDSLIPLLDEIERES
ncbi:MAG: Uncharacterized protein XE11_0760 [Methanomicrobiales archaeon 53_19]|nr:MAG: Uncharacterized protein XE11_0760 [Methanomicrobiales archaeon 53_19]